MDAADKSATTVEAYMDGTAAWRTELYTVENGTLMNRSEFRKFGIKVGALVATMRPINT